MMRDQRSLDGDQISSIIMRIDPCEIHHSMREKFLVDNFSFVENSLLLCAKNVEKMLHYVRAFVQIHINGLLVPELSLRKSQ